MYSVICPSCGRVIDGEPAKASLVLVYGFEVAKLNFKKLCGRHREPFYRTFIPV